MAGLSGLLGGLLADGQIKDIFIYNLVGQLISGVTSPFTQELTNEMNALFPLVPLSPADLANGVVRGFIDEQTAAQVAGKSGVNGTDFALLVQEAGNSIAPQQAAEALRRGIIPVDSGDPNKPGFSQAIAQGNLRDMWTDVIKQLATATPTPTMALTAYLKGQTDHDTAKSLYEKFGGDPTYFDLMFDVQGGSPTPVQAARMAMRSLIPWDGTGPEVTSYAQAFKEGQWRDKWADAFQKDAQYLPPPRTITAMVKEGSLTQGQAAKYLAENGLPADLVQSYLSSGTAQKVASSKQLAEGTVVKLYTDKIIPASAATAMLAALGYSAAEAAFLLEVQDLATAQKVMSSAISKVGSLYVSRRIQSSTAMDALAKLGIQAKEAGELLATWEIERTANVKVLTAAEVTDAFHLTLIDQTTAQSELEAIGYAPHDAWLLLSIKQKTKQPDEPK